MPWLAGERTGHVDNYIGLLEGNQLAVPRIPETFINRMEVSHEAAFAGKVNEFLNERVAQLEAAGAEIVRVPMLPPANFQKSEISPLGWDANFPWTTNWAHHGGKLLIPHYPNLMKKYGPGEHLSFYDQIRAAVGDNYKVEFVDFDQMLTRNGGMHCATMDMPPLPYMGNVRSF